MDVCCRRSEDRNARSRKVDWFTLSAQSVQMCSSDLESRSENKAVWMYSEVGADDGMRFVRSSERELKAEARRWGILPRQRRPSVLPAPAGAIAGCRGHLRNHPHYVGPPGKRLESPSEAVHVTAGIANLIDKTSPSATLFFPGLGSASHLVGKVEAIPKHLCENHTQSHYVETNVRSLKPHTYRLLNL